MKRCSIPRPAILIQSIRATSSVPRWPRIDGPLKTSGTAKYSSDWNLPGMVYAVPVCSPIASGKITSLDPGKAAGMRGVLKVYYHGNAPKLYRSNPADDDAHVDEARPVFEDDTIYYAGQYVALVVAETMDQARAGARALSPYSTQQTSRMSRAI